ncbi:MAG: DUF721 domain-containing protein [Actinomycetaceae bacterium]|nr:DUF721 domain-containing protein [Actinomycetaceae bacterium]
MNVELDFSEDLLPLLAFRRECESALARGDRRTRWKSFKKNLEKYNLEEKQRLGNDVFKPQEGVGDVGSGAKPSYKDPHMFSELCERMIKDLHWGEEFLEGRVVASWSDIVGPRNAQHGSIEKFHDGVLVVRASSSAWAKQFDMMKHEILSRVEEITGLNSVKEFTIKGPNVPSWSHGLFSVPGRGVRDTYD